MSPDDRPEELPFANDDPDTESLTALIHRWGDAESEIIARVYNEHFKRLYALSRQVLGNYPCANAAADDAVQSAIVCLCQHFRKEQNIQSKDSGDFWRLLLFLVRQKSRRRSARQTRGLKGGKLKPMTDLTLEDGATPLDELAARMTPEEFDREASEIIEQLPKNLQPLALLFLEGHTQAGAAELLGCSVRTIARKVEYLRVELQKSLNTLE